MPWQLLTLLQTVTTLTSPVMNEGGEIVGMVDVLKLTYATLEQINTMSSGDNEGPAWNKFWLLDNETESMVSGDGSHHHTHHRLPLPMSPDITRSERLVNDSVAPGDSASHAGVESRHQQRRRQLPRLPPSELPFPFKFKAPMRSCASSLQVIAAHGMDAFVSGVAAKLGKRSKPSAGCLSSRKASSSSGFALSYLDDEGDSVSITTDQDLLEAILLAEERGSEKVDLFVPRPEGATRACASSPRRSRCPFLRRLLLPSSASVGSILMRRTRRDEGEEDDSTVRTGSRRYSAPRPSSPPGRSSPAYPTSSCCLVPLSLPSHSRSSSVSSPSRGCPADKRKPAET